MLKAIVFYILFVTSLFAQSNSPSLDDALDIIKSIQSKNQSRHQHEYLQLLNWLNKTTLDIQTISGKDFTSYRGHYYKKKLYRLTDTIFSTDPNLKIAPKNRIKSLHDTFLLIIGDCRITTADNSIVFCTGDIKISHAKNDIVVSNGNVDISFDGSYKERGSLIYSRKFVDISHAYATVLAYATGVDIAHSYGVDCINTKNSNGNCNQLTSTKQENYGSQNLARLQVESPPNKTISTDTNDPAVIAESYCQSIRQMNFNLARTFMDTSALAKFDKWTSRIKDNSEKQQKMIRQTKKWTCEVKEVRKVLYETHVKIDGIADMVHLKQSNGQWKIF